MLAFHRKIYYAFLSMSLGSQTEKRLLKRDKRQFSESPSLLLKAAILIQAN